jgi:hypothetical protein
VVDDPGEVVKIIKRAHAEAGFEFSDSVTEADGT